MHWKGVIFDRDGTLFESLPLILRSFNYGIEPFTAKRPSDQEWFGAFGPHEPEVLGAFIPQEKKQEAFQRFYSYYTQHAAEIMLFPRIPDLLKRLKDHDVRVLLFTGGGAESTHFCLHNANILSFFDGLMTGEKVRNPKPDPEGILHLLDEFKLSGSETIVVGDAPADIVAGKAAGACTALARWSMAPQSGELLVKPDFVFSTVSSFEEFLFAESNRRKPCE